MVGERYGSGNWRGNRRGLLYCAAGDAQGSMFESSKHMENGGGLPLIVGTWDCEAEGKGIDPYEAGEKQSGGLDTCMKVWCEGGFG